MASRKEPVGMAACECARIGYMLVLCQVHAPIPYELTDKGRREARRMKQWDAIKDTVVESYTARQALTRAAMTEGRKIEARARRQNGKALRG